MNTSINFEKFVAAINAGMDNPANDFAFGYMAGFMNMMSVVVATCALISCGFVLFWVASEIFRNVYFACKHVEPSSEDLPIVQESITKRKTYGYCPCCGGTVEISNSFLRRHKGACCSWCGQRLQVNFYKKLR